MTEPGMHERAVELIRSLRLQPHPEGGFYREAFRSETSVALQGRPARRAVTTIYFLLPAGSFSAWHRVSADEIWHWYEGGALELLLVSPDLRQRRIHRLAPVGEGTQPSAAVPAGWWQAARPLGAFALCGCTVAPGFEFEDFALLRDQAGAAQQLRSVAPELAGLL
jgi:predicted cupin superfamily sugar epimerase